MKFALIKNNIVKNVIQAEQSFIDIHFLELDCDLALDVTGQYVGPRFSYVSGIFTPPQESDSSEDGS